MKIKLFHPTRSENLICVCSGLCQCAMAQSCVKLLCEDPAFGEYMKCILMDERNFLNNNIAYSFLTCFLHKVNTCTSTSHADLM